MNFTVTTLRRVRNTPRWTLLLPILAVVSAAYPVGLPVQAAGPDDPLPEVKKAKPLLTLRGPHGQVYQVAYSSDGKLIAAPGHRKTVRVWDASTGKRVFTLAGHSDLISDVAFSPDSKQLASASWDKTVKLWDARTGRLVRTIALSDQVGSVAFSPDGKQLVTGDGVPGGAGAVKVWEVATGKERFVTRGHPEAVLRVAYSPDGKRIASGGLDGVARVWDAVTGKEVFSLPAGQGSYVYDVVFSPDSKTLCLAAVPLGPRRRPITVWDAATGKQLYALRTDPLGGTYGVAFSPDGKLLASPISEHHGTILLAGGVKLWDAATGKGLGSVIGHDREVVSIVFSPDGKRVVSASLDHTIKVWDVARLLKQGRGQ
jgi:WD40 repeat protein